MNQGATSPEIIKLGEQIGRGQEHDCFKTIGRDSIIKIPTWFGSKWQNQTRNFVRRCLGALKKRDIPVPPVEIHESPIVIMNNGSAKIIPLVLERGYWLENIEDMRIKFKDFLDPETGPEMIKEGMKIVRDADVIFRENDLGLDPHGGKIMSDIAEGIRQSVKLKIAKFFPLISSKIPGVKGQMRNILHRDQVENQIGQHLEGTGKSVCIDPGMHNFRNNGKYRPITDFFTQMVLDLIGKTKRIEEGKYQLITRAIHHVGMAGLIESLIYANSKMPPDKQVPQEELESLPFNGTKLHRKMAKKITEIMIPLYIRYDEKTKTQTKAIDS